MSQKHFLVLGVGSVGRRHSRNLASLGCQISAMDPRADHLKEAAIEVPLIHRFTNLEDSLAKSSEYSGVIVCSPPNFHVRQAIAALKLGLPVLLEKPVSPDAESTRILADAVREAQVPLLLGYSYRWWPPVQELKCRLDQQAVGKVLHVRCVLSAHLADWHPWEHYQDFFMARRELGGGALLDESHFLDLMLWFFGMPGEVFAKIERLSALEIETDDNVDAWLAYPDGKRILVHLDLYGRPHERSITVIGDQGTLQWRYETNTLRYSQSIGQDWQETKYTCERNEMFMGTAREFVEMLDSGQAPSCTIEDGYKVLRAIEAMRRSSASGQIISLE